MNQFKDFNDFVLTSYDSPKEAHCLFQPFSKDDDLVENVSFKKLRCQKCSSLIHSTVTNKKLITDIDDQLDNDEAKEDNIKDIDSWVCQFCKTTNNISKDFDPKMNIDSFTTEVYSKHHTIKSEKSIFIIDCITDPKNLTSIKNLLFKYLPIGKFSLITIEKNGFVNLHLSNNKSVSLSIENSKIEQNCKSFNTDYFVTHYLNTYNNHDNIWYSSKSSFLKTIKTLQPSSSSVNPNDIKRREKRATGLAIFLASVIAMNDRNLGSDSKNLNHSNYDIISFISGPCTIGPGKVISADIKNLIRSHDQLDSNKNNKYYAKALKFYEKINDLSLKLTISYDFFIASLDQIGLLEWKFLLSSTCKQFDSFANEDIKPNIGINSNTDFELSWDAYCKLRNDFQIELSSLKILNTSNVNLKNMSMTNTKLILQQKLPMTVEGSNHSIESKFKFNRPLVLNPYNFIIPFELEFTNDKIATIQFQLHYYHGKQNYIKNLTINLKKSEKDNWKKKFVSEIETIFLLKKFSQQVLFQFQYNVTSINEYLINVLNYYNDGNNKGVLKEDDLKMFYQLQRSSLLIKRNVSPDEHILLANFIHNNNSIQCFRIMNPLILNLDELNYKDDNEESSLLDKMKIGPLEGNLMNSKENLLIDGGNFIELRINKEENKKEINEKLLKFFKSIAYTLINSVERFPKPRLVISYPNQSQDRYFKTKLIPMNEDECRLLNTQDQSFDQFLKTLL